MTGGIFDGFEDYRTATEDDYRRTLTGGMVVFDANVLLNLYRFNSTTRADLIKVMQSLGDSLWIPHQVMREFWRNRESVIDQLGETPKESLTRLDKARQEAEEAVRAWSNRIYLPEGERDGLLTKLNGAFQAVRHTISEQAAANAHPHDTNSDTIVATLSEILAGRTGAALPAEDHDAAVDEAERRIAAEEPPGYLDKDKVDADERAGDYLVWKQVLVEAAQRSCDVLLVTSDVKEDWWRRAKGQLRGPRLELMAEFRRSTGHRLFMITPSELIRRADALTDVHVNPKSAADIERVEQASSKGLLPPEVEGAVVAEIYQRMDSASWIDVHGTRQHRTISEWLEDPAIGGLLLEHMTANDAHSWITARALRQYFRSIYGVGPFAHLIPRRYQTASEIVHAICGPEWHVESGSEAENPYRCLAADSTNARYVLWGLETGFSRLLNTAVTLQDPELARPLIVLLHDGAVDDSDYYISAGDKLGVAVAFLERKLKPNPDYVG